MPGSFRRRMGTTGKIAGDGSAIIGDMQDVPRQVATDRDDSAFTLTVDEALERYAKAGLARTPRSVQRYCAKGHLECHRLETSFGEKYLIKPESIDKHIAYIAEIAIATSRGTTRPVATVGGSDTKDNSSSQAAMTSSDELPSLAARADARYVEQVEREVGFLRKQIEVKDDQIKDLTERARETNHLIAGLQRMLSPLLGSRHHLDADEQASAQPGA
jgi:hypothetical protein